MPKIEEHLFIAIKNRWTDHFFSANVHQYNIAFIELCMHKIVLINLYCLFLYFFLVGKGSG